MRIVYQVTDEDVRVNVVEALEEIESDEVVTYLDESEREEIIECAVDYSCDAYERNACCGGYTPQYYTTVYDTLRDYECIEC